MRSDLQLTNLQMQGHGHESPNQSDLSLSRQPGLAAQICINTTSTVDLDRDLEGTRALWPSTLQAQEEGLEHR